MPTMVTVALHGSLAAEEGCDKTGRRMGRAMQGPGPEHGAVPGTYAVLLCGAWQPFVVKLPIPPQKGLSRRSRQRTSIHVHLLRPRFDPRRLPSSTWYVRGSANRLAAAIRASVSVCVVYLLGLVTLAITLRAII